MLIVPTKHGITTVLQQKNGGIETVEAKKMGWIDLSRATFYPTFAYQFNFCWCRVKMCFFFEIAVINNNGLVLQFRLVNYSET